MFLTPRRRRALMLAAILLGLLYYFTTGNGPGDTTSDFYKSTARAMNNGLYRGHYGQQGQATKQELEQQQQQGGANGDGLQVHDIEQGPLRDKQFRKLIPNEVGEQDKQAAHPDRELELHKQKEAQAKGDANKEKEGKKGEGEGDNSGGAAADAKGEQRPPQQQPEKPIGEKEKHPAEHPDGAAPGGDEAGKKTPEAAVADELKSIFDKAPVTVFSKTYCPFSKKAKHILRKYYTMDPPPTIVDLDEHRYGAQLQTVLGEMTGRKTVPNILVNHKSLGGSDELAQLHEDGKLLDTFRTMARGPKKFEIDLTPAGKGAKEQT